jgi:hypothetical protein
VLKKKRKRYLKSFFCVCVVVLEFEFKGLMFARQALLSLEPHLQLIKLFLIILFCFILFLQC